MSISKKAPDFKIVLLGQSSSGKTCLVNRYLLGDFTLQQPTVGMAFVDKQVSVDGRTFRLGIWDTAESERYMSLTPMYYRGVSVALLCYDVASPESLAKVGYWFDQLMSHEPGCCIFIAGTKVDLVQDRASAGFQEQIRGFAEVKEIDMSHVFVTSSKTGEGVNELFSAVAHWCAKQLKAGDQGRKPEPSVLGSDGVIPSLDTPGKKKCCGH